MSNFSNYKKFENVGIRSSNDTLIIMNSSNNNISLHSSDGGDDNVDTLSIKNIINKTSNEDLNLSSLNGTTINPVITINNNHSDCRIMTNLNVNGNVNINHNLIIPNYNTNSSLLSNTYGSIYYNTSENKYKGYTNEGWASLGITKTKDTTIHKNLNVSGNINLTNGEMIQTSGIGSFGSINCDVYTYKNLNISGNLNLPVGLTSSRPSNPSFGTIRFNSEKHVFEGYSGFDGGVWINLTEPPTGLYDFISHTFTNCGATGRNGPTLAQMRSAYSGKTWVTNTEFFNSELQGYQVWTVPKTGNYQIKAYGAEGGKSAVNATQNYQGKGAWTQGDFYLTENTKLTIIVGQKGEDAVYYVNSYAGAGGGATWVLKYGSTVAEDSNLYCVAGGGGGERDSASTSTTPPNHENGGTVQNALVTNWSSVQSTFGVAHWGGSGGASYGIDGGISSSGSYNYSSFAPRNPFHSSGALGGKAGDAWGEDGGFGGGGGQGLHNAGGGGGYVGGDHGGSVGGEGGSSRNNGSSISFGNHTNSNGSVEITFISY